MSPSVLGVTVAVPLLLAAVPRPAAASPALAALDVRRGPDAAGCPDAGALAADLAAITGMPDRFVVSSAAPVRVAVAWDRTVEGGFQAKVQLEGARAGTRTLTDAGPTCAALGHAVAIALALMLDAETPADVQPAPPVASQPVFTAGHLALLAGLSWGQVAQVSGAARLELGARRGRASAVVGGERVLSQATEIAPGTVAISLWAGRLSLCALMNDPSSWVQLDACAAGAVGALHGQGQGFAGSSASSLTWWAAGGELRAQAVFRGRWVVALGADVAATLYQYTFSVAQIGAVRGSDRWTGQLLAGVGAKLW